MAEGYFLAMVVGLPVLLLVIALVAGYFYRDGAEGFLDWQPTRSPQREAELERGEVEQMLAALNRYRRRRGAPERSLEEVAGPLDAGR